MAKTSPLSRPLPNASLPRNSFDRSFIKNLNWSAGMILPWFCEFVPAGSACKINRSIFMRTAQLNTAAFPTLDHNIDFYKVPLRLLMTRYNDFKLNIQDTNSSALFPTVSGSLDPTPPSRLPYFKVSDVRSMLNAQQTVRSDIFGHDIGYNCDRLLDLLGYDDNLFFSQSLGNDRELNVMKLLAYQKVYYDHFRNTAYESNDPSAYNADRFYANGNGGRISQAADIAKLLEVHYVNYRKDYFQALYPSLNYISADNYAMNWSIPLSVVDGIQTLDQNGFPVVNVSLAQTARTTAPDSGRWTGDGVPTNPAQKAYMFMNSSRSVVDGDDHGMSHNHLFTSFQSLKHDAYSPQGIRIAFALDKLLRASAYAPKHVKDQLEARFGVKLRQSYGCESEYLGSFGNQVTIGEVTSTANTNTGSSGDDLGAIGGKGVSGSARGKTIEAFCEDDCIIIGVAYTMVRSMYDSGRVDSFNMKALREDLFNPEFMDLGLRPIYRQEFFDDGTLNAQAANYILGYVTRDQEYKLGIDQNHGLFRLNGALTYFTNHTNIASRSYAAGSSGVTGIYFKMYPGDLDSIFVTAYDYDGQLTDQFYGQVRFDFVCRQNMSVHGQPSL